MRLEEVWFMQHERTDRCVRLGRAWTSFWKASGLL